MKPLLVTSGEPAGIGPDLCLSLAEQELPLVVLADRDLLAHRAKELKRQITFIEYKAGMLVRSKPKHLTVLPLPCKTRVVSGQLNPLNSAYVINMLSLAVEKCVSGEFAALITAPVHKAVINQAGIKFSGHTEYLAQRCKVPTVVMMLACEAMRVALVTTHLPLRAVPDALSASLISSVIEQLHHSLQQDFAIKKPQIYVAGLNPHAGEGGYLGWEEIEVITPALTSLQGKGINVRGPLPADTLFTPNYLQQADAFVAMYHDQGLPVLKYAGFNSAVNVTLGLPIIRTSVDHGTALELAGTGLAETGSLLAAVEMAQKMIEARGQK